MKRAMNQSYRRSDLRHPFFSRILATLLIIGQVWSPSFFFSPSSSADAAARSRCDYNDYIKRLGSQAGERILNALRRQADLSTGAYSEEDFKKLAELYA